MRWRRSRFRARNAWSFRPNAKEYRLLQLPLRAFELDTPAGAGPTMTFEDFVANGMQIETVAIDGEWPTRFILGLDHIHLRW